MREEHPDDARSVFYNITNHGMDVYKEILPHRVAAQRDLLKVLGGEELQVVDRALTKLIEHLAKETQIT